MNVIAHNIAAMNAQRQLKIVGNAKQKSTEKLASGYRINRAAESRIRDTDMAEEMVRYAKENILQQAGQAMVAQANQSTQGVLSLLN